MTSTVHDLIELKLTPLRKRLDEQDQAIEALRKTFDEAEGNSDTRIKALDRRIVELEKPRDEWKKKMTGKA